MCKNPCIGTPEEMTKISKSGFRNQLSITMWGFGLMVGTHKDFVKMIAPSFDQEKGYCTFYENGKCKLHHLGLKPKEGRYASHENIPVDNIQELFDTPLYKCIAEWEKLEEI